MTIEEAQALINYRVACWHNMNPRLFIHRLVASLKSKKANPNRKSIIQNPGEEVVWDRLSYTHKTTLAFLFCDRKQSTLKLILQND